ncbi:hypothetical protein EDB81DRAFT_934016 [Dactylonectria macrodidyma]|uniref:Hydroxyneurosporene synthase n=1 Tax=Dactylonectria macrodidyma TaxID=307937 RepID=A0A9P9EV24_9HYPO|nr:hypothetical protein EDB81DRAFT_934016 [Dactylonectria macrodidyma]
MIFSTSSMLHAVALSLLYITAATARVFQIPNTPYDGGSVAQFKSSIGKLDGQKVTPWPNQTSFEWWYFDVASTSSSNESIIVTFYQSTPEAFFGARNDSFLSASVVGTYKNGSVFVFYPHLSETASVTVDVGLNDVAATWGDTGIGFEGSGILGRRAKYLIAIDNPELGLQGSITYQARAQAHYPCTAKLSFASERIVPNVGWANAVPDAEAKVELKVRGEAISFEGSGYHDKNWGDKPFVDTVDSWYWGHAVLGAYSVVWFDAVGVDGKEYVSGYVSKNGRVMQASCKPGVVNVRPYGGNDRYPPVKSLDYPEGFTIYFDLGHTGKLRVNARQSVVLMAKDLRGSQ